MLITGLYTPTGAVDCLRLFPGGVCKCNISSAALCGQGRKVEEGPRRRSPSDVMPQPQLNIHTDTL